MPQTSGTGIDTLVIKGGGLTDSVIVKVSRGATEDFMALPATETTSTQSTLRWIRHPQATGYRIDLYSGDQPISKEVKDTTKPSKFITAQEKTSIFRNTVYGNRQTEAEVSERNFF